MEKKDQVPLDPKFYPEFQYQSKGLIKDFLGKKKEVAQLQEVLESVLIKYNRLKNPYFLNFSHITNYANSDTSKDISYKNAAFNGTYSDLELFYQVLVRKGFTEIKEHSQLLHKLLLTTWFEAIYLGFSKEVERHKSDTLDKTLQNWIEESGAIFRKELPLFLYHLWASDQKTYQIQFNPQAESDVNCPLVNPEILTKLMATCETIYYQILVGRLDVKLTKFDPDIYVTIHHIDAMGGFEFEDFLVELFRVIGYDVKETKRTGDQGADLFVEKFGQKTVIQVKNYINNVSNAAVQQVLSAKQFYGCDNAMVITNSYFTKSAIELAEATKVQLINRDRLKSYIDEYNQFLIDDSEELNLTE